MSAPDNLGYVVAGYVLTASTLGAYVARLFARARRAKRRGTVPSGPPAR